MFVGYITQWNRSDNDVTGRDYLLHPTSEAVKPKSKRATTSPDHVCRDESVTTTVTVVKGRD